MTDTGDLKPSLLVDMKKNRIRIHKNTLHALGNPCFVVLIVNPEEHTLGIKCSSQDDKLAHRIKQSTMNSKVCYELYSKSLTLALRRVCPEWNDIGKYKLEGEIIHAENMAVFPMVDVSAQ